MPNVTIYIASEQMPSTAALAALTDECTGLCTAILNATLENVHVIYISAQHGRGNPAFAEVRYRLEPSRTSPVMERFVEELDAAITRHTGLIARVRCFGYSTIFARN